MPILIPYRITDRFIIAHSELTFIYSNDVLNKGGMGMCWFMAGHKNSYPIPTLMKFCANKIFFYDAGIETNIMYIDRAIEQIPIENPIIVPPKIGLGCADMKQHCPKTYAYLRKRLNDIMCHDIKIDYGS